MEKSVYTQVIYLREGSLLNEFRLRPQEAVPTA